jgi:hypothetical protein
MLFCQTNPYYLPTALIRSPENYLELKEYLEKHFGVTMLKKRALLPVYDIIFDDP